MSIASIAARAWPGWLRPGRGPGPALQAMAVANVRHAHATWESEPFIPVSRFEIADRMALSGLWGDVPPDTIGRLFRYLSAWRHVVYKERLDDLERTYLPFSPETDLLLTGNFPPERIADYRARFIGGIKRLLQQANYIEVPREDVPKLMRRGGVHNLALSVDLDDFEECVVYRRGTDSRIESWPTWRTLFLWKQEFRIPVYQRLCVMLKLWPEDIRVAQIMERKSVSRERAQAIVRRSRSTLPEGLDGNRIYIKIFRDIPHTNLEMLFPNTHIEFSSFDKIRLGGFAAGGVCAGVFGAVSSLQTAAVLSPYLLAGAVFGLGSVLFRQVLGIFNQRTQYTKTLVENLYFRSLADNRSAFTLLANRAEEEDVKEEMLLYSSLATEKVYRKDLPALRARISTYLKAQFDITVAFDIYDALDRLMRDGIVREREDGLLETLAPMAALERFDVMWNGYLQPSGLDRNLLGEEPPLR